MEDRCRPDPDKLLAHVQAEERQKTRGRLKIFLGYAAGVGKTFAMLEAAHQRRDEGADVVAAYVETHGRAETEAMLRDLEVLPPLRIEYRGLFLSEIDVPAVLARRPQLVLVDELAHTNAPGSCHLKRFQDVEDLLTAGIDVYTTLNIQHMESLRDVVAQITGVVVRETIPDRVLDEAAEIELIDLPPDELLRRLQEGKVYIPEQAERAAQKFFRPGNLTALREVALRRAAERVDEQMRVYMQVQAIAGPWPATERLLVCVGPSPFSERLVRTARRLADGLKATWMALYVETPEYPHLTQAQQDQLARTLQLAEQLGGQAATLPGPRAVDTILAYARQHNVTKIIVGKPVRARWYEGFKPSLVDRLIAASGAIDVYVITEAPETERPAKVGQYQAQGLRWRYGQAVLLVVAATLLSLPFRPYMDPTNLVMIYLLAVVLAAVYLGRGPAVLASVLSVLAFDFFLVPPHLTLAVADTQYLLTFFGLLAVSLVISTLTAQVREQAEAAHRRETHTAALYALSRALALATSVEEMIQAVLSNVGETTGQEVVLLLPDTALDGRLRAHSLPSVTALDAHELAVATWVFEHGQVAGQGTDTLPAARARYLPLRTARRTVGVLGIQVKHPSRPLTPEERRLMEAFAGLSALAIEQAQLAEAARRTQLLEATEKLQTALLNSISHDLRTPLVSITGALSSLQEEQSTLLDAAARRSLLETAREEADRLNRLVGNLLDMTRLEAGAMKLNREPGDVQDLIGTTLEQLRSRLGERPVAVEAEENLPLVPMDFVLIVHVLANLIDNAIKYSPENSPIEICAHVSGPEVKLEVADRGIGIPAEDLPRIFDKFYRVQRPESVTGTGLGLSISRGIVEAHGGRIWARNRPEGGTIITFTLPLHPLALLQGETSP